MSDHLPQLPLYFLFLRSLFQMWLYSDYFGVSFLNLALPFCRLYFYLSWSCVVEERGFKWYQETWICVTPLRISAFMHPNRWVWTRRISRFGTECSLRFHPALQFCHFFVLLFCILHNMDSCCACHLHLHKVMSTYYARYCFNTPAKSTHWILSTIHELVQ